MWAAAEQGGLYYSVSFPAKHGDRTDVKEAGMPPKKQLLNIKMQILMFFIGKRESLV